MHTIPVQTYVHQKRPLQAIKWSRFGGYDVSTKGDKRFSAFYARLPDGRNIEEHYQCDVKGYDVGGKNWRLGKGKPPRTPRDTWPEYLALWRIWAHLNPSLIEELQEKVKSHNNLISDRFATTQINQARALKEILNETADLSYPVLMRS